MGFADRIKALFSRRTLGEDSYEDLTDLLVEGDIGAAFAVEIVDELKAVCRRERISSQEGARMALKSILSKYIPSREFVIDQSKLTVILVLGVNGVGKTTSCAKMACWARSKGSENIILAAGDTFRAAAVNQLKIHGQRLGIRVVAQDTGSDAAAVLWDAVEAATAQGRGLVIADTAGRMHTRQDLVRELEKMDRILKQKAPQADYRRLLAIDATTGQNGLRQAETFSSAIKLDGVILTKYDSTARGGLVFSLSHQLGLATAFVGTGESYPDFTPFNPESFLTDFIGT